MQCKVYNAECSLCSVDCILFSVHYTVGSVEVSSALGSFSVK